MRSDEIAGARDLLKEFVQEVFASFTRNEQRGKGSLYLQGLMLEGRRKSIQPMGGRLGVDYQQLQQSRIRSILGGIPPSRIRAVSALPYSNRNG